MSYAPGYVPVQYDAAFFARELRRIQEVLNFEEAIGNLSLDPDDAPIADTITTTPTKVPIWGLRGPDPNLSDGPIKTDPRLSPAGEIQVQSGGIYQVGFFLTFQHDFAVEVFFELYVNEARTFFFDALDNTNQQQEASVSATVQAIFQEGDLISLRSYTLAGTDDVNFIAGEMFVHKLRDLRTRFS